MSFTLIESEEGRGVKKAFSIDAYRSLHGLQVFLRFTSGKDKDFNLECVIGRDVCAFFLF